ncbi:tripartite tricarboxylate transporter substrate binding protein [Cupriavidus necator]|uniref:Bug family tripartite tricarboxylate transporter substrate binding protein n=1 Tax=Cupriavidus necator TaxID=106590 RepID=UPI0039C13412
MSFQRLKNRAMRGGGAVLAVAAFLMTAAPASAADYPSRPVRLVVPYGPGGTGDVIARVLSARLGAALGQPVVVENRPGGAGVIGATTVKSSEPDGYTLLLGFTTEMVVSPSVVRGLSYQTDRDFQPVAFAGTTPLLLVAHPSVGARTMQSLISNAKSKPISYASGGKGSPSHIAGALLAKAAGIDMLHVPYKGGSQAVADLLAGNINIYFSGIPPAIPYVKAGKLIALGVTSTHPSPALPETPALATTFPQLDLSGWFGVFVPKQVPAPIVEKLNKEIVAALQIPEVRLKLLEQGVEIKPMSPQQFGAFVDAERKKYERLVRELNITQEQ